MARRRKMLGSVNLLGLNSFGQNPGMSPLIGIGIGGGVAVGTTLAIQHTTNNPNADLFGWLAGLGASGVMYAMPSTRHAAVAGALSATIASGLSFLAKKFMGSATVTVPGTAAGTSGMGYPAARALNGLGIAQMRALNGLGLPMVSNVPQSQGTIPGVAGSQLAAPGGGGPPISLMGTQSAAAGHLLGIGGPPIHGLAASYGATLLGAGR